MFNYYSDSTLNTGNPLVFEVPERFFETDLLLIVNLYFLKDEV